MEVRLLKIPFLTLGFILLMGSLSPANSSSLIIHDQESVTRPQRIDIVGQLHRNSLGGALWYSLPLIHEGFIKELNDSFHLELGVITSYILLTDHYAAFFGIPAVGVRWDFHLTQEWTLFAISKVGWMLGLTRNPEYPLYPYPSLGAYWQTQNGLNLRLETSHEGLAQVGISLPF